MKSNCFQFKKDEAVMRYLPDFEKEELPERDFFFGVKMFLRFHLLDYCDLT